MEWKTTKNELPELINISTPRVLFSVEDHIFTGIFIDEDGTKGFQRMDAPRIYENILYPIDEVDYWMYIPKLPEKLINSFNI